MKWILMDDIETFTDAKAICDLVNIIVDKGEYDTEYFEVDNKRGHVMSIDHIIMIAPKSDFDINELDPGKGGEYSFSMHMLRKIISLCGDYDDRLIIPNKAVPMKIRCNNFDIYIAPRIEEGDEE